MKHTTQKVRIQKQQLLLVKFRCVTENIRGKIINTPDIKNRRPESHTKSVPPFENSESCSFRIANFGLWVRFQFSFLSIIITGGSSVSFPLCLSYLLIGS
jgi:hypothetical protein